MMSTYFLKPVHLLVVAAAAIALAVVAMSGGTGLANEVCASATLRDSYGFQLRGVFIPSTTQPSAVAPEHAQVEIAATGRMVFDGRGGVTAAYTESLGGSIIPGSGAGTYSVQPDCTGSLTLAEDDRTTPLDFTIMERGETIVLMVAEPGGVALGSDSRQGRAKRGQQRTENFPSESGLVPLIVGSPADRKWTQANEVHFPNPGLHAGNSQDESPGHLGIQGVRRRDKRWTTSPPLTAYS